MYKKRFVGVITVKSGIAVQSFGFNRYLPLGDPVILAENLDRWGIDEIVVNSIDRTRLALGPDWDLLESLKRCELRTPITFGGGIETVEHAISIIKGGAERVCIGDILIQNPGVVKSISRKIGAQAIIASVPVDIKDGNLRGYDYMRRAHFPISQLDPAVLDQEFISELLLIDYKNDGSDGLFNPDIFLNSEFLKIPLILFGGITDFIVMRTVLGARQVRGIAIGNSLSYTEHAVQKIRETVDVSNFRKARYLHRSFC